MAAPKTRELWLQQGVKQLTPLFTRQEVKVPEVRVSVGWPKGARGSKKTGVAIGQCWPTVYAHDKVAQLFISPQLEDPVRILDVLAHELVHAADDCQSGHRGDFVKLAKAIGLVGPWTATKAGDDLKVTLTKIADKLGPFPHAALKSSGEKGGPPKQGTRMLKLECVDCGYVVRTTRKWIEVGMPTCSCGTEFQEVG